MTCKGILHTDRIDLPIYFCYPRNRVPTCYREHCSSGRFHMFTHRKFLQILSGVAVLFIMIFGFSVPTVSAQGKATIEREQSESKASPALQGTGKYDDVHAGWTYSGFIATTTTGPYNGTLHVSKAVGGTAEFTFTGSQVTLWYSKYSNRGTLEVYLDDGPDPIATIDQYGATRVWQASWTSKDLGEGKHTIRFLHSVGGQVDIDAIEVKTDTPPGAGKYDDVHTSWMYSGFIATTTTGPYNGTLHVSKAVGGTAEFTFTGSQVTLWYSKYSNRGTLEVYLDDGPDPIATIDQYGATRVWQASWTSKDLGEGEHTIRFLHSVGGQVDIDAIEVKTYTLPSGAGTYDDLHSGWTFSGGFSIQNSTSAYDSGIHYSTTMGSYAEFTFTGSQVILLYTGDTNRGEVDVFLDGTDAVHKIGMINQYTGITNYQKVWKSGDLGEGEHTIWFVHAGAAGKMMNIDAITVGTYAPPPALVNPWTDDDYPGWVYNGTFTTRTKAKAYDGSFQYTTTAGDYAEIRFTGSYAILLYTGAADRGKVDVYLDGTDDAHKIATINQYTETANYQKAWKSGNLGEGEHTIRFVHAGATGKVINIDALMVSTYLTETWTCPVPLGIYDDDNPSAPTCWTYNEPFTTLTSSTYNPYGDSFQYTTAVGDYAEFNFIGSRVTLYYISGTSGGKVDVYLDGVDAAHKIGTINQYTSSEMEQEWTSGNLGEGEHTIRFMHAGPGGSMITIDAIVVKDYTMPWAATEATWDDARTIGWMYNGTFTNIANASAYEDHFQYTTTMGDYVDFRFIGSQVTLHYIGRINRGVVDVYLDGTDEAHKIGTINQYTTSEIEQLWTSGNLGEGEHIIRFVHAGPQNGLMVTFDAITVRTTYMPPNLGVFDDLNSNLVYSTGFTTQTVTDAYARGSHYATAADSYVEFTFRGSRFVLVYTGNTNGGDVEVYVGSAISPVATIHQYSSKRVAQKKWISPDLGVGEHTIRLKHSAASGKIMDIDAILIPPGNGTYDNTHANWFYSSGFSTQTVSGAYGGVIHSSTATGKAAEFIFVGRQFKLIYTGNTNRAKVTVYVDGVNLATISEARSSLMPQRTWKSPVLAAGAHIVKFVHAGPADKVMDIDAIQILGGVVGPGMYDDTDLAVWTYSGTWTTSSELDVYNNTLTSNDGAGDYAEVTFTGARFTVTYGGVDYIDPEDTASFDVYIDGEWVRKVNNGTLGIWYGSWTSAPLEMGEHTVRFVNAGEGPISFDSIEIE